MLDFRHYVKNISWLLIDKIIRITVGLVVGIWVARYLGPSNFGILNFAIAFVAFFSFLSKLGLDQIIVREITKNEKLSYKILGSAFGLKFIGGLLALLLSLISISIIKEDATTKLIVGLLATGFVFQAFDVIDYYYQAKILSKYVVIARTSSFILANGLKAFLILHSYDVRFFGLAILFDFFLVSIFLMIAYKTNNISVEKWNFDLTYAKSLLTYSWPLIFSSFIIIIYTKIDQIMIDAFLNSTQVGVYSVAVTLSNYWLFIPGILVSTLMPYFVKLRNSDLKTYRKRLLQLYSLMFWMGAFIGIIVLVFGQNVIIFLYGNEYASSYKALMLNIWSSIFISQAIARGIWLISENLQKYRLYNNLLAVSLNIIGNFILIPRYGIAGAAIATLITQGMGTWIFSLFWKPIRSSTIDLFRSINPIYIYSLFKDLIKIKGSNN